jgi:hypothetical protein
VALINHSLFEGVAIGRRLAISSLTLDLIHFAEPPRFPDSRKEEGFELGTGA